MRLRLPQLLVLTATAALIATACGDDSKPQEPPED
ncbi:MAG: hypothetical protein RL385_5496, partial [Pseudomonadota bacterium]